MDTQTAVSPAGQTVTSLDALLLGKSLQRRHSSHGVRREAYIGNARLPMLFVV